MISDEGNPLAEVALALSMAFFSLMVLMLFSITQEQNDREETQKVDFEYSDNAENSKITDEVLLIFADGKFYDKNLNNINAETHESERVLLAVDPNLPMSDIMIATQFFKNKDLQLTTFSENWKQRLGYDKQQTD